MDIELELARLFAEGHPDAAAQLLEGLEIGTVALFLNALPAPSAAAVVQVMESFTATRCLEELGADRAGAVVDQLPLERAAALLRRLEQKGRDAIVAVLPDEQAGMLGLLLHYPESTAGALMNARVFTLPPDIAVEEALRRVRLHSRYAMYYLYVIGQDQRLAGVVNMRELMLAGPEERIDAVMHREVVRLAAGATLSAILVHPGWLEYHTLPVVDDDNRFIGALRHKNLRRLVGESEGRRREGGVEFAGAALGELFQIGLTGLVKGAAGGLGSDTNE